jgi:hypothetical protein
MAMTRFRNYLIAGTALFAIFAVAAHAPAAPQLDGYDPDEAAVRFALQMYMDGQATGRADVMAHVFAENARLSAVVEGKFTLQTADEFFATLPGQPTAHEADCRRWVQSVDVVGDMAVARVVQLYPGVRFVDYMVLHRIGEDWKIVHQAYQAQER